MRSTRIAARMTGPRADRRRSSSQSLRSDPPERRLILGVCAAALLAWVAVATLPGGHGAHSAHEAQGGIGAGDLTGVRVLGWLAMVVAMMVPPALPLFTTVERLVKRKRHPHLLVVVSALSFVAVWLFSGLAFLFADTLWSVAVQRMPSLANNRSATVGLGVALVGLYQFTPAKKACLRACRTPRSVAIAHWRGVRLPLIEVATIGAAFGGICVGCCWALMALTMVVGVAALPVMVAMSLVMSAERLLPSIRTIVPAIAWGCLALGALIAAGIVPSGVA